MSEPGRGGDVERAGTEGLKVDIGDGKKPVGYSIRQEHVRERAVGGFDSGCAGWTRNCEASR